MLNVPTDRLSTLPVVEGSYGAEKLNQTMLHTLEKVFVFDISINTASVVSDRIVIYFGQEHLWAKFSPFMCGEMNDAFVKENGF